MLIEQVMQVAPSLLVSIDVPTGWLVDEDNSNRTGVIQPQMLISLTLPVEMMIDPIYFRSCLLNGSKECMSWLPIY